MDEKKREIANLSINSIPEDLTPSPAEITANLNKLFETKIQLSQVQSSLNGIIDAIKKDESFFTKVSTFWGERPLWQKIVTGVVISVPTLVVGIVAHIGFLLAISGVTVVAYTASSLLLDEHHSTNKNLVEELKKGVNHLGNLLVIVITALDTIREKFAEELEKFREENEKLIKHIAALSFEVDRLHAQTEALSATEKLLRSTREKLTADLQVLEASSQKNSELFLACQSELTQVSKEYKISQEQLLEKVRELAEVKTSMGLELDKAKKIATTLQGTIQTLSGTVIEDEKQRHSFQEKLDHFLADGKASFDQVAARICSAERELAAVKEQLKESNQRYKNLLDRQEEQVKRLEQLSEENSLLHGLTQQHGHFAAKRQLLSKKKLAKMGDFLDPNSENFAVVQS